MSVELLLFLFFLVILGGVTAAGYLLVLRPSEEPESPATDLAPATATLPEGRITGADLLIDAFRRIGGAIPGATEEDNPYRKKLIAAGYRWPSALPVYYGIKCASALLVAILTTWIAISLSADTTIILLPMICGGAFGYMMPDRILTMLASARAKRLRRALPSALDLMVLALEAGQSLDQSIIDTSRALKSSHPDLATELLLLHLDLRANTSRADSLRNLAERNEDPELRKVTTLLIDADRFGTTLGPALRTHSRYLRIRFRQKAQEAARKLSVKLIFPVFFLIFPSVVLVTLGPAAIMIMTQLKAMAGSI